MNKLTILAAIILLGALNANFVKADALHHEQSSAAAGEETTPAGAPEQLPQEVKGY